MFASLLLYQYHHPNHYCLNRLSWYITNWTIIVWIITTVLSPPEPLLSESALLFYHSWSRSDWQRQREGGRKGGGGWEMMMEVMEVERAEGLHNCCTWQVLYWLVERAALLHNCYTWHVLYWPVEGAVAGVTELLHLTDPLLTGRGSNSRCYRTFRREPVPIADTIHTRTCPDWKRVSK